MLILTRKVSRFFKKRFIIVLVLKLYVETLRYHKPEPAKLSVINFPGLPFTKHFIFSAIPYRCSRETCISAITTSQQVSYFERGLTFDTARKWNGLKGLILLVWTSSIICITVWKIRVKVIHCGHKRQSCRNENYYTHRPLLLTAT